MIPPYIVRSPHITVSKCINGLTYSYMRTNTIFVPFARLRYIPERVIKINGFFFRPAINCILHRAQLTRVKNWNAYAIIKRRAHERRFNHRPPSVIDSEQQSYVRVAFLSRETRDSPIRRRSVRYTVIGYDLRGAFRNPRRRVNKQELAVICSSRLSARPSDPKAKTLPVILFRAARINTATETLQLYLRRDRNRDSPHAFEGKLSCARTAPRSDIIYVYIYMIGNQLPTG